MSISAAALFEHIDSCSTLHLSTLSERGTPHASYAPFAREGERFYILISEAARHCGYLMHHGECAVMFIEDETTAGQIFARKRISLECRTTVVPRNDPSFARRTGLLEARFGGIVPMLLGMKDFHLFELLPLSGEAVFGFGDAYRFHGDFSRIEPKTSGHRKS